MSNVAAVPYTVATNPAVVSQPDSQLAPALNFPLLTTIMKLPWKLPVTPAAIVLPGVPLGSQASGLGPATVTNRPSMKVSVTLKVPFAFDVVAASKVRMYVSLAQSLPQVPESGELLLIG